MSSYRYTLYGVAAILLWGSLLGLMRAVAEAFGPVGGAALIYTVASVFLIVATGMPRLSRFTPGYLLIGGALFVSYEICLSLSVGMANDRHQSMEMAVINYLWPALTVLLAVLVNRRPVSVLVYPSILLAFIGVAWTIAGDSGLSPEELYRNFASNPVTYTLAFTGAVIWAVYCNVTKRLANGQNAITLFFMATAVALWIKFALTDTAPMTISGSSITLLLIAGVIMGSGYALWNLAIIGGNMMLLATLSYFTPVISTLFSSLILSVTLSGSFWQGVSMVTVGSLICWWVTRDSGKSAQLVSEEA